MRLASPGSTHGPSTSAAASAALVAALTEGCRSLRAACRIAHDHDDALSAALAFALGAVVLRDGGPELLGIPYERLLLVHLSLAVIGWLTVLIASVGRTLVPMLGLAPAAARRRAPVAEVVLVTGLWLYLAGVAWSVDALAASRRLTAGR